MVEKENISPSEPLEATGVLVLDDGTIFWGNGLGAEGLKTGELVFNTSVTGYQEILTDPSYASQIICFTFPHIGNVGVNSEDEESSNPSALGCILRSDITNPSNWRARDHLGTWLKKNNLIGLSGVDTRKITSLLREKGSLNAVISHQADQNFNLDQLLTNASDWEGIEGSDLAKQVSCKKSYSWNKTTWKLQKGFETQEETSIEQKFKVVVIDFGVKRNMLRHLANNGCKIIVVPAQSSAEEILSHKPDGIFLSNGPGDPVATGKYAVPEIKKLLKTQKPIFGICLGHQILALSLGAKTFKLKFGHRGANQPIKNLENGRVEITSQNHGFCVDRNSLPSNVKETHKSLFDGVLEGIRLIDKPVFSVQYHPDASPGPQDSHYLFKNFINLMKKNKDNNNSI